MVDCIDPDIRICNLGSLFEPDADAAKAQQCYYPPSLGVKACIRNINLQFNDQYVQQLREVNNVLSLTNLQGTNGSALNILN